VTARRRPASEAVGGPDARARKILFKLFWNAGGWTDRDARSLSPDDRDWATAHGMLFPRHTTTHDGLVAELASVCAAVPLAKAAGHFLASLSTGRPELRSGLATRTLADRVVAHSFVGGDAFCAACGAYPAYRDEDLDVLQFERHKWSGIRHANPLFQWFDLARLAVEPPPRPTDADRMAFEGVLRVIADAAPDERPGRLAGRLAELVGEGAPAREGIVEVLAAAGILRPSGPRPGGGDRFEFAGDWRGVDGFDRDRVAVLFGAYGIVPR